MHVISRKALRVFWEKHPDSHNALIRWFKIISHTDFEDFQTLKHTFSSADLVGNLVVFNIGGNKYRLIASIHFNRSKVYIRHVLPHSEYDRGNWETMSAIPKDIEGHWAAIQPLLTIRTEAEYDQAVERLNALLDEVGTDDSHPLYEFLDTLGALIQVYEEKHHHIPTSTGVDTLRYLMAEHGLSAADLSNLGRDVDEILQGRKELQIDQIRLLSKRFGVSPAVFV